MSPTAPTPQTNHSLRTTTQTTSTGMPYLSGLDGLRALAVLAVLLYHADIAWIPAGFLGVDIFLVISGFLITALLLTERRETGRINLRRFWLRRARRLLPALFVVLILTFLFTALFLPNELARIRGEVLAAIGYVTNWHLIFKNESYFEGFGRPPLLRHLWSLAVEEQFYLLWPPVFIGGMWLLGTRGLFVAVLVGATMSTALMWLLFEPSTDPSRIYFGTDTRAAALLVGAALAFIWQPWNHTSNRLVKSSSIASDLIGIAALLGVTLWVLYLSEFGSFLYQGGFLFVALTTAAVVMAAVHPYGRLGLFLGFTPLRWIGTRSYGIYLWHWPVFMLTRPDLDINLDGIPLLALRFIITIALAEISYRVVEQPIRHGTIGYSWNRLYNHRSLPIPRVATITIAITAGVALLAAFALFPIDAKNSLTSEKVLSTNTATSLPQFNSDTHTHHPIALPGNESPATFTSTNTPTKPHPAIPSDQNFNSGSASAMNTNSTKITIIPSASAPLIPLPNTASERIGRQILATIQSPTAIIPLFTALTFVAKNPQQLEPKFVIIMPTSPITVLAIGDSVMLGAAGVLHDTISGIWINADVSRQFQSGTKVLREFKTQGKLPNTIVIHLGTNGPFSHSHFDEMMLVLQDIPRVLFVNVRLPHRVEANVNEMLLLGVERWNNAFLVDWHKVSNRQPDYFRDDGVHMKGTGAIAYANLIASHL